jgi:hypothetical protein
LKTNTPRWITEVMETISSCFADITELAYKTSILLKSQKLHILYSKHAFIVTLYPHLLHFHLLTDSKEQNPSCEDNTYSEYLNRLNSSGAKKTSRLGMNWWTYVGSKYDLFSDIILALSERMDPPMKNIH